MPLFYQHNINEVTKLGIWRIEEPPSFFLEKVPLKNDVTHPFKRLQHLAGRYLLPLLFPDFPLGEILIADTRKPFLSSEKYHFSISHSGSFAAAIVSATGRVGVDIESITPRIRALAHKFVGESEQQALPGDPQAVPGDPPAFPGEEMLTLIWCAKESIFKWYSLGEVDFRRHMQFRGPILRHADGIRMPFLFEKGITIALDVEARVFSELSLALAWVIT
ncbi:MAG: 4'-phosphopantetheinyl transferase superfamily protein [Bacteroidota bacterium]|nr:4'-phosphopantetheinyl transferase superfamily protein [Bacteroidota bacterium]MDP4215464.1 4'-phosphopantetheinyl transferase superfamily protein [Bacteroidota bacterium]MDP4247036.1 4'-phosphopantetheinyl transferase superfamily protein [Bacteroidota bacterium]MDP4255271.1 4'-phosphopantetheinyl transferase superfamily protein [Bacteroidota bacterium]MDP4257492.1 4'-phosphopantetheinyl transferase superfamily protein [Bacteroidota bacterium]